MRIVIGTDLSDGAAIALRWAVEEARVHDADLEALMVWDPIYQDADWSDFFDLDQSEDVARKALESWVVDELGAEADVARRVVIDAPARGLLEASDAADLCVLGARGIGGFKGLLLGSTSDRVAQMATRPVAIVRAPSPVHGGRVVVGVDGSASSLDALRWAADEARARGADLDLVHAWRPSMAMASPYVWPAYEKLEAAARTVLDDAAADPSLDGVRVHQHFERESPGEALVRRSEGAGAVVVGSRGRGRIAGTLLGSVSRQLLHHAHCPVVVV